MTPVPRTICIAQFRPDKSDPGSALRRAGATIERALDRDPNTRLIVFPETALTGYFLEGGVYEEARTAPEWFEALDGEHGRRGLPPVDVAAGFYERHERKFSNSAIYVRLGEGGGIVHVHRKVFLPTYGLFQEARFVSPGAGVAAFDTRLGRTAMLVCEDAFHSVTGALAALDGAQLLLVLCASPARGARSPDGPENLATWDVIGSRLAAEHGIFVILAQLAGFEGGKGFPGGSTAYDPAGQRIASGPLWDQALVPVTINPGDVSRVRGQAPHLADLEQAWRRLMANSPGAADR